ncbi:hypothetical protein M378DRAFT_179357 [Amanita muscaria Koide BX008]|uniref:MSP domain-containing protein n=1 Tax=Amanita muscaria (strain Koide BX008) TaxID=946122 RepID=A0A0C2X260_AMAMK|nr:hypothetical protein M378DRAFT_179357 [Amanita muscaria Koide BX008]
MSVSLNPSNALGFHRPLTQLAKRSLTITNNNHQPIAFKVKTTAPKLYCVRPNSGRVEPGHTVEVSGEAVMLQAMREEPPQNAKCKDKFLIQSTLITPDKETLSLQDIWAAPEGAEELTKVHQQKLRVTYLPPEGQTVPEEAEPQVPPVTDEPPPIQLNGVHHSSSSTDAKHNGIHDDVDHSKQEFEPNTKEAQRSMTPHNEYTVAREESNENDEHAREVPIQDLPPHSRIPSAPTPLAVSAFETQISHPEDEEEEEEHLPAPEPDQAPLSIPLPSSRLPSGQPSISGRFQPEDIESHPVFQELVSRYNATIAELEHVRNEYASESGLRRRRPRSDTGSVASDTEIMDDGAYHQDGVPLQIVVIIALAVFVTTYLFL